MFQDSEVWNVYQLLFCDIIAILIDCVHSVVRIVTTEL